MKIRTQLHLGLGVILVLVALLGATAWFQAESLWQTTAGLYNHPLTVRRAIGEIRLNILTMHQAMEDLFLADGDEERQEIITSVDAAEARAAEQLAVLRDRYLGPQSHIAAVQDGLARWKSVRDETIRLLRTGKRAEALARQKSTGADGRETAALLEAVRRMDVFARDRGDKFYQDAQTQERVLAMRLWILLGAILLIAAVISSLLLKTIRSPLEELTAAAERYRKGDLASRSGYVSANEFGTLSAAFNALAGTVETELQRRESAARVAEVMLREEELGAFCRELLKALLDHTGSQVGAVYLLNAAKTGFEHFESIGLAASDRQVEFGLALATRQIQLTRDIPSDARCTVSTIIGELVPREILTIPVLSGEEVAAVVSLASVRSYPEPVIRLVNDLWSVLAARLNGALRLRQLHMFSERLEHQNRELESQKRELSLQAAELGEQNIELEWQQKQLREANRLKSTFLSNMSHELRTPLNSVIALSGVLGRRLAGTIPKEERGYLEVIERNGRLLLALINNILELSRLEAGREEVHPTHFQIGGLIAEVVSLIEPLAQEKNITLSSCVAGDPPPVYSDLTKCRHILQNLVGNAVKFTEQGGVEITAAADQGGIRIAVADTGIGIAAGQLEHIFDEFRQADESTTKRYGGTGLGLSIARKYAALLGGTILVESTPGKGSTFAFWLPQGVARPTPPPAARDGRNRRLLLVEDSEPAVIQLTDILAGQGYRVEVARDGGEALQRIEANLPDAMILDLMMPEVDGFEVLRAIRASPRTAHVPVLILTAKYVTREELSFLKENHIHQLIQKGDINRADLLAAIAGMVPKEIAFDFEQSDDTGD